jgi:hypothetical protein
VALGAVMLAAVIGGVLMAGPAFAGNAVNGDGTMSVSTPSVTAGLPTQLTFTFAAQNGKDFSTGSLVTLVVPATWTQPTSANTSVANFVHATCNPVASFSIGPGPWTISVTQACAGGDSFRIIYGTSSNITAPQTAGQALFSAASRAGSSGNASALGASPTVTVAAGPAAKLGFVQAPSDAFVGSAMTPAVTVQVQDQFGNPVSQSGVSVTLTPSAGTIASGASASTSGAGLATFSGITINATALGITLSASATGLSTATSSAFNVTVKVTTASAALTDAASDAGAGVKSVAYYYCAGYVGACTSGTLIGNSTTSSGGYPVTWTGQPANGAYRVVAVGIDNVNNMSVASASIPVTIAN